MATNLESLKIMLEDISNEPSEKELSETEKSQIEASARKAEQLCKSANGKSLLSGPQRAKLVEDLATGLT